MISTTLADCEDYRIVHHFQNSEKTVISFSYLNQGMSDKGFGSDFILKNGFNNIYVSGKNNDYFQSLSGDQFKEAVSAAIEGRDIITYGLSLGAYAAIYYACFINAYAVAFSPRCSVHPVLAGNDKRFKHKYMSGITTKPEHPPVVILDPFDHTDFKFLTDALLKAFKNINVIHIDNCGHEPLTALRESGLMKQFVLDLLNKKIPTTTIENKYKEHYLYRKGKTLSGNPDAKKYILQLLETYPNKQSFDLARDFSLRNNIPMPIPDPTPEMIAKCLEPLDKKYNKPEMIVDIILDVAKSLEGAGAYRFALSQYKIAKCKWPGNKEITNKINEIEEFLRINQTSN